MRSLAVVLGICACSSSPAAVPDGGASDGQGNGDAPVGAGADAPPASRAVAIIVEPDGQGGKQLVDAIAAAQTSIYMTMYEIDSTAMLDALAARAQAGVDVQVVLDGAASTRAFNLPGHDRLAAAGAAVVWSSHFTLTHEKAVIIDGHAAWIMTMNLNNSSPKYNREYIAIDTDPADIAEATTVFAADHAGQTIVPSGALVVANANARALLVGLIDSATSTLDVEGEEFSDKISNGITAAVARAARRGVTTHVVIANSALDATSVASVKTAGAKVVMTGPTSGHGTATRPYIHAKAIVVDCATPSTCRRGFVGSENFSTGSLSYNRELGVVFGTAAELAKVKTTIDTDFVAGIAQ